MQEGLIKMKVVEVTTKKDEKKYIEFRKKIYSLNPNYVDNNLFMIKELFNKKTSFTDNKKIYVEKAVKLLFDKAKELGKKHKCKKIVVGLNGHVNYGLGFLNSDYDKKNSFSYSVNPEYYNDYFKKLKCEEINLKTYKLNSIDNRLDKYNPIINKLNKNYTFKTFDKKKFNYYSKIYTDLNNKTFNKHRYYYKRTYKEDKEMLKELFLFMKEESLIFAFDNNKQVGFIMWYKDFNELVKTKEAFGPKHFIRNIFYDKFT